MLGPLTLRAHRARGLTMIELILVLGVLSVLVALAVPSMADYIQRKRVDGVANELATSLRMARTLPLQTGNQVWISFRNSASDTCYTVHSDPGDAVCDCTATPVCSLAVIGVQPVEYRTVLLPRSTGVELAASPVVVRFAATNGLPDVVAMAADITSTRGGSLRVNVNSAGRPDICSISGHASYPSCP